jgi:hypothetical protein
MIEVIASREDDEVKTYMIQTLAHYMKQQYIIWNKDSVSDETIFRDIEKLSDGRIVIPQDMQIVSSNPDGQNHQRKNGPKKNMLRGKDNKMNNNKKRKK